jgi:hypothetical protein
VNDHRFDRLAKALAYRTDRREVARMAARSSIALLVGGLALGGRKSDKVAICHRTGNPANPWVYITVSESAVSAHRGHGDTIEPDFLNDPANCGGCGVVCGGDAEDLCRRRVCGRGDHL